MIPLPIRFLPGLFTLLCGYSVSLPCEAQESPLTPEQSVALALKQNPQAQASRFARDAAQVQVEREKPVFRPSITAVAAGTLQGSRVSLPRLNGTNTTVLPEEFYQLHLTVEQTLYRPGLSAARQRYSAQSQALELDFQKSLAELALSVHKAYLNVLRAEAGIQTAREGLAFAERYRSFVLKQIETGFAKPVDAQTVAAQVAEAKAGMTKAEGGLELARLNFNREIGRPLTAPVLLESQKEIPQVPTTPEEAAERAMKVRVELQQLEQNLIAARAGVLLARTQSQPSLNARGQLIEQTRTALLPQTYAAATLEVRWPLGDNGKARLDTQEAQAQVKRLEALLEATRQGIALEVRQAWQKMREARDRIVFTQEQVKGAQAALTVADKAYEVGRGTLIEVQAAQRELRSAQDREREARFDLLSAEADFLSAQGALLPAHPTSSTFQGGKSPVSALPRIPAKSALQVSPSGSGK